MADAWIRLLSLDVPRDLRSLALFRETHRPRLAVVVCNEPEPRVVNAVRILPWRLFFEELWNGRIMGG